jgi:hypothetical protein
MYRFADAISKMTLAISLVARIKSEMTRAILLLTRVKSEIAPVILLLLCAKLPHGAVGPRL